ncbi:Poly(A)-specific ribonuclease PARN [Tetrabaena socialis]|uniref:Poly(A)-specific ribonuclease PARN n=1 Tax=Tetrabaena socialis TaxID=47790 RepID=A0A2J8AIL1_9CHLO|nr:Poly(A)-specific ribonuclease PARN [Tetrabaena socialis]|eukprot:PNH12351.1 Poly(A)-specific ribonuclease PARN [Tetrabaena socialis]
MAWGELPFLWYTRTAAAAHSFVITQFGISCFKRLTPGGEGAEGEPRYLAATFNFYVFPRPAENGSAGSQASRRFTCDAGSLAFLASQGFDFNRCIYDGIPFMPVRQRDELLRQLERDYGGGAEGGGGGGNDVVLSKAEDIAFVQGLVASVREWLAAGATRGEALVLPVVNRYLRLLSYQALARPENFGGPAGGAPGWHPGFYVKKVRITFLPGNNALVEVASQETAAAAGGGALEGRGLCAEVLPYAAYWARKEAMLAAGTWPLAGYGGYGGGGGGGGARGAPAANNGAARPAKRPRAPEPEPEPEQQQVKLPPQAVQVPVPAPTAEAAQAPRMCAIM